MSVLDDIIAKKRISLAIEKEKISLLELERQAKSVSPTRGFSNAIQAKNIALIAEIKKGSPSKGMIRPDFNPAAHANEYQAGGASCLSVLTDIHFFGCDAHFAAARQTCNLPMLRKDFMIDPWQIVQSKALGADCILLILAVLSDAEALEMAEIAIRNQLDVLVETHNQDEVKRALALPETCMIGINNRNLHTFDTDLANTEKLIKLIGKNRIVISESGITNPRDVTRVKKAGAAGILVGESLMRQNDLARATRELLIGQTA